MMKSLNHAIKIPSVTSHLNSSGPPAYKSRFVDKKPKIFFFLFVYTFLKRTFDYFLPFPVQALSLWLMSREQGLRVTAVVTDSYGLSSSSGRKTSSDGEVTISAEYLFESCKETEMKTSIITINVGRAQLTPAGTALVELNTNPLLILLM